MSKIEVNEIAARSGTTVSVPAELTLTGGADITASAFDDAGAQLKIGGKMVVPVGNSDAQVMCLIEKLSDNKNKVTEHVFFQLAAVACITNIV